MEYKLVKINNLSGDEASIYSLRSSESGQTLFEDFVIENKELHTEEVKAIYSTIKLMGSKFGVRDNFLKLNEGIPGDGVCALYDDESSNLRLYAIKFGKTLIVLGNGGFKPKNIRASQEDEKLKQANDLMRVLSSRITLKMKDKEIRLSNDYMSFEGELDFEID